MSFLSDLSIDQVFDWHRVNTPDISYAIFSDEDGSEVRFLFTMVFHDYSCFFFQTNITWSTLGSAIYRCIGLIKDSITECVTGKSSERPIVVGILSNSGKGN